MNNKEFVSELAARAGYSAQQTQRMMTTLTTLMADNLTETDSLGVTGFGTFEVKKRLERIIVNPGTGKRMLVPPKLTLTFKPTVAWKEKARGKEQEGGEA